MRMVVLTVWVSWERGKKPPATSSGRHGKALSSESQEQRRCSAGVTRVSGHFAWLAVHTQPRVPFPLCGKSADERERQRDPSVKVKPGGAVAQVLVESR